MKTNLLTKQLIISILLGFVPYCLLNILFSGFMSNAAQKEVNLATDYHVQSVSQALENTIVNFEEMTQWMIGNDEIHAFLILPEDASREQYDSTYRRANSQLFLLPFSAKPFASISIFRNDGEQLISGSLSHTPQQLTEAERLTAAQLRGGWFWSVEKDQLAICRLIRDESQLSSHLGYIRLLFDPEAMLRDLTIGTASDGEFFALVRKDGQLLFSTFTQEERRLLDVESLRQLVCGEADKLQSELRDRYSLRYQEIPDKSVSVVCLRRLNPSLMWSHRGSILLFSFLPACLIVFFQFFLTERWMIHPLNKLERLMRSIEKEDYSVRFHVRGHDEIAAVGTRFNEMCGKLQSLYEEVYQSNLKARDAEILALQAEINPHFMFNTLDNIYWMVQIGKTEQAKSMIRALSESFRITLYKTEDGFVTLQMAVAQAENYLFIQQMRLQNNLRYTIEVEEGLDLEHTMVLHLVLQPLVENCIKHGISKEGQGEVIVMISRQEQTLNYSIYDTGGEADVERIERSLREAPKGSHGLALYNVNSRIRLKFGNEYGVSFSRPADGGTMFFVKQPLIVRTEAK